MQLSHLATMYVVVPIYAEHDPTTDTVQMAFTASAATAPASWTTAQWTSSYANGQATCACLVGPAGSVTLLPGDYQIWVKVTDDPEVPVLAVPSELGIF